jgi:hypothetical protein
MPRVVVAKTLLCLLSAALPASLRAEEAPSILDKMRQHRIERCAGVENYTVILDCDGQRSVRYYERIAETDPAAAPSFRLMVAAGGGGVSPAESPASAEVLRASSGATAQAIVRDLSQVGIPSDLLRLVGVEPWNMLESTGGRETAIAENLRLAGEEQVDGRTAYRLVADDVALEPPSDGREFTINTITLWVDAEHYVTLRLRVAGAAKQGDVTKAAFVEQSFSDFRVVEGARMFEPYRRMHRVGVESTPDERQEMEQARQRLRQFQMQIEHLSHGQRETVVEQMRPEMEELRRLASGAGFEAVSEVRRILVNAGPPDADTLHGILPAPAAGRN